MVQFLKNGRVFQADRYGVVIVDGERISIDDPRLHAHVHECAEHERANEWLCVRPCPAGHIPACPRCGG